MPFSLSLLFSTDIAIGAKLRLHSVQEQREDGACFEVDPMEIIQCPLLFVYIFLSIYNLSIYFCLNICKLQCAGAEGG